MTVKNFVLVTCWLSIVGFAWTTVLGIVEPDGLSWGFFIFFCIVALFVSTSGDDDSKDQNNDGK